MSKKIVALEVGMKGQVRMIEKEPNISIDLSYSGEM